MFVKQSRHTKYEYVELSVSGLRILSDKSLDANYALTQQTTGLDNGHRTALGASHATLSYHASRTGAALRHTPCRGALRTITAHCAAIPAVGAAGELLCRRQARTEDLPVPSGGSRQPSASPAPPDDAGAPEKRHRVTHSPKSAGTVQTVPIREPEPTIMTSYLSTACVMHSK